MPTTFAKSSESAMFVVLDFTEISRFTKVPQAALFAPVSAVDVPKTSQAAVLVVYGTGAREDNSLRAWSFIQDGHAFYVLHLGMLGTYVCDTSAGNEWSQWETAGMETWNAVQGLMWQDLIVAGDNQNPALWIIDPETQLDDDFKPIVHTATANIPARGRGTVSIGMLSVNASAGFPVNTAATLTLRFSDDNGNTWVDMEPVTLEAGNFNQSLQFGSLGTFGQPGRIIEISDVGGMIRLSDADIQATGGQYETDDGR